MWWTATLIDDPRWLLMIRLVAAATLLVATALLALRMVTAPVWRRTIAQAAAIGLLLVLFGELTGVVEPLGDSLARLRAVGDVANAGAKSLAAPQLETTMELGLIGEFDMGPQSVDAPINSTFAGRITLESAL